MQLSFIVPEDIRKKSAIHSDFSMILMERGNAIDRDENRKKSVAEIVQRVLSSEIPVSI
jgi:hypothetical protein